MGVIEIKSVLGFTSGFIIIYILAVFINRGVHPFTRFMEWGRNWRKEICRISNLYC